jgi:hypothetical protein
MGTISSRRKRIALVLVVFWVVATVVCGGFYIYYPWKFQEPVDEYVRYPDFRTVQFLVLWLFPTLLYTVISVVAVIRVGKRKSDIF